MSPLHDIRGDREVIRARMAEIEAEIERGGEGGGRSRVLATMRSAAATSRSMTTPGPVTSSNRPGTAGFASRGSRMRWHRQSGISTGEAWPRQH